MRLELMRKMVPMDVVEAVTFVWSRSRQQQLPLAIFLVLCMNLVVAPVVYAAADGQLARRAAWALGVLGLVTLLLIAYLFVVVFQPERF